MNQVQYGKSIEFTSGKILLVHNTFWIKLQFIFLSITIADSRFSYNKFFVYLCSGSISFGGIIPCIPFPFKSNSLQLCFSLYCLPNKKKMKRSIIINIELGQVVIQNEKLCNSIDGETIDFRIKQSGNEWACLHQLSVRYFSWFRRIFTQKTQ